MLRMPDDIEGALRAYFAAGGAGLSAVYLFGSVARGDIPGLD